MIVSFSKLFIVLGLANLVLQVAAIPGNLNCDGEKWVPGDPFPDPGGDMGDIPMYTLGPASDCKITIQGGFSAIKPCASYVVTVTSDYSVGHKLSTSSGLLTGHPDSDTEEQNDRCRHRYSQVETKYIYRAISNAASHKFYSICGKINGPMNTKTLAISQQVGAFPASCPTVCDSPNGDACFAPTPAPTAEAPGTAQNNEGKENSAVTRKMAVSVSLLIALISFVLIM